MFANDTIAAISSATGPAARMIVRISGPSARSLATILDIPPSEANSAQHQSIKFSGISVPAWTYQFISPRSYTGEDLVELHIPGNPLLARMLLDWLTANGARQSDPGEFTARAYFHGKLDLSQAEGVAAAISAQSDLQLLAARQLMAGELANRLRPAMELLAESLALVEAGIDFSEERMEFLSTDQIRHRIDTVLNQLQTLSSQSRQLEKLAHEPTIVLAGRPNAGKSTLTNALAGKNRSIVSPHPGTTRDALSVEIALPRGIARLIDIAGLDSPDGEIAQQMQNLAERAIEQADVLVLVRDSTDPRPDVPLARTPDLRVFTKTDLLDAVSTAENSISISAKSGQGLEALRNKLDTITFGSDTAGANLALTSRHLQSLGEAITALARARIVLDSLELLAAELRDALDSLGQILGIVSPDDILGQIFSKFCIGK
jgi:tRNA modification GTPase